MNKRKQFFIIFFKIKVFLNDGAKQSNDNVGRDANVARLRRSVDALVGVCLLSRVKLTFTSKLL